jgi:predicted enzyme related to lactoylglutathione lyase
MGDNVTGSIDWHDLTVADASRVRDFYAEVVGWTTSSTSMGDYNDFNMHDSGGNIVAGICHARGSNARLPPQWLCYVTIANLDASVAACTRLGGSVIDGPRTIGADSVCVIRDPAGAVLALYQKAAAQETGGALGPG